MNLLKNTLVSKLMLAALMLVGALSLSAQTKPRIYIAPFEIKDYEEHTIPVMLSHDGTMASLQFDIVVSDALELVGVPARNGDNLARSQSFTTNFMKTVKDENGKDTYVADSDAKTGNHARVGITSRKDAFPMTDGAVAFLTVRAKKDALTEDAILKIFIKDARVSAVRVSDGSFTLTDAEYESGVNVTVDSELIMSVNGENLSVNPAGKIRIGFNVKNEVEYLAAFQADVLIPEGFSIDENSIVNGARLGNGAYVEMYPSKTNPQDIRFLISDIEENKAVTGSEGEIFSFELTAPAEFPEEVEVKVSNIEGAGPNSRPYIAKDFSFKVRNANSDRVNANDNAYKADIEAIAALQQELDAAVEAVKENADYDVTADKKAAQDLIDAAKAAADAQYEAVKAEGNYKSALDAEPIKTAIAAIAKNSAAATDKAAAEKAAAEIKALNDKLAAALESIAKNCPLVADDFKGENVADAIKALQAKVDAAVADGSLTEKYDEVMANTIGELIDTLVKEAEIAQAAAVEAEAAEKARKENNEKAYKEDLAAIDALTQKLQAEIKALEDHFNAIGETEPNWVLVEQTNILVKIRDLKTKADNENDRVAKEGDYRKQVDALDTMLVNQLIAAYVANVKTSGIDSIISDENLGNVRIYTIDGVQHNTLVPGVNIIVKEDGTTTKVYVK